VLASLGQKTPTLSPELRSGSEPDGFTFGRIRRESETNLRCAGFVPAYYGPSVPSGHGFPRQLKYIQLGATLTPQSW